MYPIRVLIYFNYFNTCKKYQNNIIYKMDEVLYIVVFDLENYSYFRFLLHQTKTTSIKLLHLIVDRQMSHD